MQKNLFDFASQNQNESLKKSGDVSSNNNTYFSKNTTQNFGDNTTPKNSFQDSFNNQNSQNFANCQNNASPSGANPSIEEQARSAYEKYQNYSQDELMDEFLKTSKQKLRDGSLTPEKLQNTVNTLSPFLNNTQKEFLKGLINKLND